MTTATWDIAYPEQKIGFRILHLAEREENYARALCGKVRHDTPLEPNAAPGHDGELCVVCAEVHWRKHGYAYMERA